MSEPNAQPLISAALIVKNEESLLPECLDSLKGIVSDIVVVDTGSTDNTKSIALSKGARVYDYPWHDDFSAARNESLRHCRGQWILVIDADERLVDGQHLLDTIGKVDSQVAGILVTIISSARNMNNHVDTFANSICRCFRNSPSIRYRGEIHEQIIDSILEHAYTLAQTQSTLVHLGYDLPREEMILKQQRNLKLIEQSLKKHPGDPYLTFQLAKTLMSCDMKQEALHIFQKLNEHADQSTIFLQALNLQAVLHLQLGNTKEAIEVATRSTDIEPRQVFAHFILGDIQTSLGENVRALEHYEAIRQYKNNVAAKASLAGDYVLPVPELCFRIGRTLTALQRYNEAEQEYLRGLKQDPNNLSCAVGIADLSLKKGNPDVAVRLLSEAVKREPMREDIAKFLQIAEQALKQSEQPGSGDGRTKAQEQERRQQRQKLSLLMIVKNEEDYLPDCLESVEGLCDELIVNDTGSTDRTVTIAESFGAKVLHNPWEGDFAKARNQALEQCTGDWVLYLDADERINREQIPYIKSLLAHAPEGIGAYACLISSNHSQSGGGKQRHTAGYPRLFRNLGYPNIAFTGRVHEQISGALLDLGYGIDVSEISIEHLGYDIGRDEMESKVRRNYTLLIEHVKEEPENAYAWFQLGQTLGLMHGLAESEQQQHAIEQNALESLQMAWNIGDLSNHVAASCAATLALIEGRRKHYKQALHWAEASLERAPLQVSASNLRGYALLHLKRFEEAEQQFKNAIAIQEKKTGIPHTGYDIELKPEILERGLELAKKKLSPKQ